MQKMLLFLLTILLCAVQVVAQVEAGTIAGTVTDKSGAVIMNATVKAKNVATQAERTVQTNSTGQYTIPGLPSGPYEITVTVGQFAPYKTRAVVTTGGRLGVDATLAVAGEATVVEVVGEGGGTQVNTQNQELSQIISSDQVSGLPSLTRNPYDFVAIAGNVSSADRTGSGGDQNSTGRGVGFAINGQRTSSTEVLMDGVENIDLFTATYGEQIPIDAVQEYRVITSNFDAQYGRAGGGVVNLTSRTGTNTFHGSAWEFNRQAAFTANTYDNVSKDLPKGQYRRNVFGYSVGGPLIKDKLFAFQTTEWTRVRSNASLSALVPTPQLLALTPANVRAYFNAYGKNNFTFADTISAGTAGVPGVPAATPAFGLVNYNAPADAGGGTPQNTHRLLGRLDFNMTNKTQMFFRYGLESYNGFVGSFFNSPYSQYDVGYQQYNNAALYSINHGFSNAVLSNTKVSFSRLNNGDLFDPSVVHVPELLLTSGASIAGQPVLLPGLWAQYSGTGGEPYGGPQNVLQINQDVSWVKGRHSMKFGGTFMYEQINRAYGAYNQGLEQLGKAKSDGLANLMAGNLYLFQAAINPQGKFPCPRNFPGSNALIVTPACTITTPVNSPSFARSLRYHDWAIYAQDSFRFTNRLTINYGMRYEHFGVQHNALQTLDSNFYYGPGANVYQQTRTGSVSLAPQSSVGQMWHPNWGTVSPRLGFAYDLFGNGKTSLRGGFGIAYERNFGNVTFNVIQNPPNYASVQLIAPTLGITIPVTTDNFGPFGGTGISVPLSPLSLRHVNQNIDTAQTQFYSMALERELAFRTVLSLEYSGAHGVHLYDIAAYNDAGGGQAYLGDPFTGVYSRANAQYSGINTRGSGGTSRYNALNVRIQTTNLHNTGLSLLVNYTWAHSLDDLSSTFSDSTGGASNGIGSLGYLDPRNPKLDWGSSDYDVRHRLAITPQWETPWYRSGLGWRHQVLGGWTFSPVFSARTGVPFSIFDSTNYINGLNVPRYVPASAVTSFSTGSPINLGQNTFTFSTLPAGVSFADPVLGISDFGIDAFKGTWPANMTRRNAFRGPGAWNLDVALSKSFTITERVKLQLRAEAFDFLNHHNFYVNGLNLDVFNFGGGPVLVQGSKGGLGVNAIGGNHDERRYGQFALRISF